MWAEVRGRISLHTTGNGRPAHHRGGRFHVSHIMPNTPPNNFLMIIMLQRIL